MKAINPETYHGFHGFYIIQKLFISNFGGKPTPESNCFLIFLCKNQGKSAQKDKCQEKLSFFSCAGLGITHQFIIPDFKQFSRKKIYQSDYHPGTECVIGAFFDYDDASCNTVSPVRIVKQWF